MNKSAMKTFSLSFLTFAAVAVSATEQHPSVRPVAVTMESARAGLMSTAEIARGWEAQQRLLDERLVERAIQGVAIPGTILSPPLPGFVLNRADVSVAKAARKAARPAQRTSPTVVSEKP